MTTASSSHGACGMRGAFRDDVTVPRVPLHSTRATQLIRPSIANNQETLK